VSILIPDLVSHGARGGCGLLLGPVRLEDRAIYMGMVCLVAIVAGMLIGKLKLGVGRRTSTRSIPWNGGQLRRTDVQERLVSGPAPNQEILQKVWLYVVMDRYWVFSRVCPEDFWSVCRPAEPVPVPVRRCLGVPLYSNAAGVIPIVYAFMEKGDEHGTVLAS